MQLKCKHFKHYYMWVYSRKLMIATILGAAYTYTRCALTFALIIKPVGFLFMFLLFAFARNVSHKTIARNLTLSCKV